MQFFIVILLFCASLGVFIPLSGDAAEEKPETAIGSGTWNGSVVVNILPDEDLGSAPFSVGIRDYRLRVSKNLNIGSQLTLTAGGGYSLKEIDAQSAARLPDELHSLFLEAGAHYKFNQRSFATLKFFPGLYSDFTDIGTDDVRMPLLLIGGYTFDSGITMVGGFAYRFGYRSGAFIPVIGASYQPNATWRIDLMAPRPGVTYSATSKIKIFAAGDFASDEYELKDGAYGAKVIKYSDYKLMGGVEYLPLPDVKLTGSAGYAFDRQFSFYDGNRQSVAIDNVPFFRLSADVSW